MRVIKFRAWDKENGIMSEGLPFEWFISGDGIDMEFRKTDESLPLKDFRYYFDHFVIMQFTCLLDKDGKEIYEGDIVNAYRNRKGVVAYHDERGMFILQDGFNEPLFEFYPIEVIGNIYENPELAGLNQGTEDGNKKQ